MMGIAGIIIIAAFLLAVLVFRLWMWLTKNDKDIEWLATELKDSCDFYCTYINYGTFLDIAKWLVKEYGRDKEVFIIKLSLRLYSAFKKDGITMNDALEIEREVMRMGNKIPFKHLAKQLEA